MPNTTNSLKSVSPNDVHAKPISRSPPASKRQLPTIFLADDATSADQVALAVCEILGQRVTTTDTDSLSHHIESLDEGDIQVINSGTRALSGETAKVRNHFLANHVFARGRPIPILQIDSRLRGIGNALRGIYESLDFNFLLFIPAEPELGRLVQRGIYYHVENGRPLPFHQSALARSAERPLGNSDLRDFIAQELRISQERVFSIEEEDVSKGPDAIVNFIRGLGKPGKVILIPDIAGPEDFGAVSSAWDKLERERILIAGSRTFLRSLFVSVAPRNAGTRRAKLLSDAIDHQKRGAPLAVICSLESAMNTQIEFARQASGPNLVTVDFDSSVILADDRTIQRELDRTHGLVMSSLKAMRPVLLRTSRARVFTDLADQQRQLDILSKVVADKRVLECVTALFIAGGQTAETIKRVLDISVVEILGSFQKSIPWGEPVGGPFKHTPLVTKGGRLGKENVLFEFFEQGHLLPRANVLPVVTPLTKDKEVDELGIEKLIAHLLRLGTTDIFAVGNAGEFRFLTNEQRLKTLEVFAKKAEGKLRVFAGVTGDSADETRQNYDAAAKLGIHTAVVMPLYFLNHSDEILPFVVNLASGRPQLPLILYNNPERTKGQNISFEVVEALEFPVVAIKDSSGDLDRLDRYARFLPVYEGQQRQFFEGYLHGARGGIGIIGHVSRLPNEFFAPTTTASRREEIARQMNDLSKTVKQGGAEVAAYKFVLSLMGIMGDTVASNEAARELTATQREQIRASNTQLISQFRVS